MKSWRGRAYALLEGRPFGVAIMTLIVLNVIALVFGTTATGQYYESWLYRFEAFSVLVFTVEYLLRLWACVEEERFRRSLAGRSRFALTPLAVIDLLAILPFYLPMLIPLDLRFLRTARLLRVFRLLKLGRYSRSLQLLIRVLLAKSTELLATLSIVAVLWVITASLMYYCEHEVQPDKFPDIPAAMWWSIVTLTTVGYGDVFPVTTLGRLLGGITALLGIGFLALPTGVLASGFIEELNRRTQAESSVASVPAAASTASTIPQRCPHCGKELTEPPAAGPT